MSVINLGEILYVLLERVGEPRARHYVQLLPRVVTMIEADAAQPLGAAEMKHKYKLGYANSFSTTLAMTLKATLGIRKAG